MSDNTLYWHDYETFGTDPFRSRPVQFAGVRTDEDLNIIGEPLNIFARLAPDTLPQPMSTLITGITPQDSLEKGLPEDEFIRRIHEELSQPGTCGVGYNSIRFDDEVTRNTLYRNLYDPYTREWQNGNSRWDIIDVVRACRDLRPEGIVWPVKEENGRTSFKLDELTVANGIGHEQAHDALSDVYATIAMARLIREKQPKLYDFCYKLRRKQEVSKHIDLRGMSPILHTSGMYGSDHGNTRLVVPVATHPVNKNSVIVFDLSQDPAMLLEHGHKKLKERLYTRAEDLPEGVERPALKQILLNKCPVIAPLSTLDGTSAKRLQIDLVRCQQNRQALLAARKAIQAKIAKIFEPQEFEPQTDPELMIYGGGFFADSDKRTMARIHETAPEKLGEQSWVFEDRRLPELLLRFRARNYPQTLTEEERGQWLEHCRDRLVNGDSGHMSFEQFFNEVERIKREEPLDERGKQLLAEVERYGRELRASLVGE
ncbi:MAG: exodeoxyribonuclease I [Gammaproteobacteria bacterium]|nr:exodeoxyribonuclease I [Gammaproteobacteria bacterium]MCW8840480.1 exodeoxyribonuclease I [Gammaproteobacteria bacterium]MCW8927457.1 exodeoxyribonuclease I [Gammaproteobacteria bacterium]MCW8958435.1 exodeoxyribonuclease I [Gammaproteobacteria bacterium]MCW8972577.1 exodeoxyribonuclease I [Gammaproteobacteria bacterium]